MSGGGGGVGGGGVRVTIPSSVRKTIQNIKEITNNHTDEEIYAMLKDCSMDPNETAQKLLIQDPFHEVKRKRDRKKESKNNREFVDSRWRRSTQGRGIRGSRANFSPRYASHDASGGKNFGPGWDNGASQAAEKSVGPSFPASQEKMKEVTQPASSADIVNQDETSLPFSADKLGTAASPIDTNKKTTVAFGNGDILEESVPSSNDSSMSVTPLSSSTVCFSSSDPVLVPSNNAWIPSTVSKTMREVGNHQTVGESNVVVPTEKLASGIGSSFLQGKMPSKSLGGKTQLNESSRNASTLVHGSSSGSRPSSNYSSRSPRMIGTQKVGLNKEWKPKPTDANVPQGSGTGASFDVLNISVEVNSQSRPASSILESEEATSKLQKKLEELHLPQRLHVIIPDHILVPESERTKLSFGSFDAGFGVTSTYVSGPESEKSSTPLSESSHGIEEFAEEQIASNQNTLVTSEEGTYTRSPSNVPENLSGEDDVNSNSAPDYNEAKQENISLSGGHQYAVVHTSPTYSFGIMPPMLGGQIATFENSESQARDASCLPNFVVQQPLDPINYYAQYYRPGADGDGRVSPFFPPGVATKYSGNVTVLPQHSSQSQQEGGNSLVLSTTGLNPLVTQADGLMQSSIPVTQQPVPAFRPPTGLHVSHYPPNYIPYGHYFSPYYVPPHGIHQFLSNGGFPQQPQAGNVYPATPAVATTGVKYSLPQYKPGTSTGNSTQMGMPSGYGPYDSFQASYNPSSLGTGGNSNVNEDLGTSQFKESNVYATTQQSEGSAVWVAAPNRDMSSLPASSFYNLPPHAQHLTFAPTPAGHGTFPGIYHPSQAVTAPAVHPLLQQSQAMAGAVDMVGPAAGVYQQPQHNWPRNY